MPKVVTPTNPPSAAADPADATPPADASAGADTSSDTAAAALVAAPASVKPAVPKLIKVRIAGQYPLYHPYQNVTIRDTLTPVALDGWVEAQLQAGLLIEGE